MSRPSPTPRVEVVAHLTDDADRAAVTAAATDLGVACEPLSPATAEPELERFLVFRVPAKHADRLVTRLHAEAGVDAAYVKPAGEAP